MATYDVDSRNKVLRLAKPLVVGSLRILPHERVVHCLLAFEYLTVHLPLVVVPDPSARPRKHGSNGKEKTHLPRLEDVTLWID